MAIPLPIDDEDAANLLVVSLTLTAFNCLLVFLVILASGDFFAKIANIGRVEPYLWLLPAGFGGVGLYQALSYWAIRKKNYTVLGKTRVVRSLFQIGSQILLGVFRAGPIGLLVGHIIGEGGGSGGLARLSWKKDKQLFKTVSIMKSREVAWRYRKFPFYMTWASILNSAGLQIPPVLFASFYGPKVAGWFFLTQKVIAMPVTLIGRSVSQVFVGEVAELANSDPVALRKLFRKINLKLLLSGLGPCLLVVLFGEKFFATVFGNNWLVSGKYAQLMAFVYLLKLSSESLINHALLERQEISLIWGTIRLILVCSAIVTFHSLGYSDFAAVAAFSAAMLISYITNFALWNYAINCKIRDHTRTFGGQRG
jgi:O-antigen/teichoic acid export membrane protein